MLVAELVIIVVGLVFIHGWRGVLPIAVLLWAILHLLAVFS